MSQHNHPLLSYKAYYLPVLLLSLAGIVDSLYLFYSHYQNYTDPTYASFCAISRAVNCDTVAQSPWSVLFGLPLALWGVVGYLFFLLVLIPLRKAEKESLPLWSFLVVNGALYSIMALFLGYVSTSKVHSHCILCILSFAISFSLFYLSWLIRRRFSSSSLFSDVVDSLKLRSTRKFMIGTLVTMLVLVLSFTFFLPHYWEFSFPDSGRDLPHGITEGGNPWVGAENPTLTINEFSDYMCFQCKKMHFFLRQLVRIYPNQIRLVHRHFPMDHLYNPLVTEKYHSGTGKMSIIALYASIKGQFWKVNDLLFEIAGHKKDFNTQTIAEFMEVPVGELAVALSDRYLRLRLKHDIAVGIDQGITGTPGFIIDGQVYIGTIPKGVLQKMMSENEK